MMSKRKGKLGSRFSDFLREEGMYEETTTAAVKKVLAWQLEEAMKKQSLSKNQMAKAMSTSRSQLDRILDPDNASIKLETVFKAARVLGRELRIELV